MGGAWVVHRLSISAGWANNAACVGSAVRLAALLRLCARVRLASLGLQRRLGAWSTGLRDEMRGRFHVKHSLDHPAFLRSSRTAAGCYGGRHRGRCKKVPGTAVRYSMLQLPLSNSFRGILFNNNSRSEYNNSLTPNVTRVPFHRCQPCHPGASQRCPSSGSTSSVGGRMSSSRRSGVHSCSVRGGIASALASPCRSPARLASR